MEHNFFKYKKTIWISLRGQLNGGILYLLPGIFIKVLYLIPLLFLWSVLAGSGVDVGMTLSQMLRYTVYNAILSELLVVQTVASSWSYEGQLVSLYARPAPVFGQLIAQTIGGWIPGLLLFSLPVFLIAPLCGISMLPQTLWFFPSLFLCVSLGFAIDFLFACVTIRLHGMAWLAYSIRMAVIALFSGTLIPFKLLPFGLQRFFELQPFGSLGGAPLALFAGTGEPARILLMQLVWNLLLWPAAVLWFKKSKEMQVSFGG